MLLICKAHFIIVDPFILCFTVQYQYEMGQTNYYYYLTNSTVQIPLLTAKQFNKVAICSCN